MFKNKVEESSELRDNKEGKANSKNKSIKLDKADYWEWRCTIEEWQNAKKELRLAQKEFNLMDREIQIATLKKSMFINVIRSREDTGNLHEKEYFKFKERLEKKYGISLENKVIDDVTFEVKILEKEK